MKIVTWNVNGIRARAGELADWLAREQPDVVCLQEIKASPEHVPQEIGALPEYWSFWHGHKGYSGVSMLLRRETFPGRPHFSHPEFDHETRIVSARAGDFELSSIYVPNGGKDFQAKLKFLEAMERHAAQAQERGTRLVLCGDLNVAREERDVHPTLRKPDQIGQTPHERALLERIIARGLADLLRKFAPDDDRLFTWWAPWRNMKQKNIGWRLDFVLASERIPAASCKSFREFGTSDHAPVQAVIDPGPLVYQPAPEPEKTVEPEKPPQGQLTLI
jgi:exodeoxyribonuclease-3